MTDFPINLDEARGIIAVSKSRHADGNGTTTDIDYRYLERIVSELIASRERIVDLEMGCKKAGCIIRQADDARHLKDIMDFLSLENEGEWDNEIEFIKRYLADIEGGKP